MTSIEHYKSLISDEEVVRALIKESKAKEGELLKEKTRVRPNLNFFQRTVTNLVTSNKRVNTRKETVHKGTEKPVRGKIKTPHTIIKEIVSSNKIDFIKANRKITLVGDEFISSVKKVEDGQIVKPSSSSGNISSVEREYKEDLDKYFVRASETVNKRKLVQNRNLTFHNTAKSRNIVFNLNINKDRLVTPTVIEKRNGQSSSVQKLCNNNVMTVSSSSSSSSDDEVIQISESDSN